MITNLANVMKYYKKKDTELFFIYNFNLFFVNPVLIL